MTKGKEYPKTTPRQHIGIAKPPSKATLMHNAISAFAMIMGKE